MYRIQTHTDKRGEPLETTIYEPVMENSDSTTIKTEGTKRRGFDENIEHDFGNPEVRAIKNNTPINVLN